MKEIKCIDCGKKFTATNKKKKLCPECAENHKTISWELRNEKNRIERQKKKLRIRNEGFLKDINAADKLNVSYGKYKAMRLSGVVE